MKNILFSLFALTAALSVQPAMAQDGQELFKSKPCAACHSIDTKLVGPALKDVAAKYGSDAKAADNLASKIQKGSQGTWGPVPMPPNVKVSDADAKALAQWILTLK